MSIQNSGITIRLARKAAGLTQEKLSEGICSVTMLSQIENGSRGVSASTFEALMTRAGQSVKAIPCFTNRTDFDCFYSLKRALFYINSWQLENAYNELDFVESRHWANNKFHYAEWLLLHAKIQFYSGTCNHEKNYQLLLQCIAITNPALSVSDFSSRLLSLCEIETLIMIAHEALYINQAELSYNICIQLNQYIEHSDFSHMDKSHLLADVTIVLSKYYLRNQKYELALPIVESTRHEMALLQFDMQLLQLTFLNALCLYHLEKYKEAIHLFKVALYSAHAIHSCYFTTCIHYVREYLTDLSLDTISSLDEIPPFHFEGKQHETNEYLSDGTYTLHTPDVLSIGKLIRQLRIEQHVSQLTLCQGLCSKAKLSKIETGQQNANILLLEALLQRLGISERPFTFWGNETENLFHELKFKSLRSQQLRPDDLKRYILEMESLTTEKDILQKQFILFRKAYFCPTPEEQLSMLFDALHCTLPSFNINHIHDYRLSWAELSCLNNIARIYYKTNTPLESFRYFNQLCDYYEATTPDILFRYTTYTLTQNMFCHSLYEQKRYLDIIHTFSSLQNTWANSPLKSLASFLFYYSQAHGECELLEETQNYGNYACALEYLCSLDKNALLLKQYLYDDFSITLNI